MLKQGMPPVHPGEILKEMYLDPLWVNNTQLADNLGVARKYDLWQAGTKISVNQVRPFRERIIKATKAKTSRTQLA